PCDGAYKVVGEYIKPSQTCGYVTKTRRYENDCDRCGCGCYICLGFNCCESCEQTRQEWECEDDPSYLNFKIYSGAQPYPAVVSGSDYVVRHKNDRAQFNLTRVDGVWIMP
ncbi:MAG: hypothetical protein C4523_15985, partial [Myxococcales bacterium]